IIKVLGSKHRENDFMKLYKYLVRTQQFKKAERLVRFQERSSGRSELTRWLAVELLYKKGHYQQALNACFAKRKSFSSIKYRREIDLTIARCYLRLGETKKSINAYVKFQKLYPSDYLAPEVLWKIAWLYEDLKNQLMARHYYQKLIATYPKNKFISEARFRIGLSHYRENQFDVARQEWAKFAALERSDYRRARFRYWVAKTYLKQQKFEQYLKELSSLAENPFRSYYNLKSFLLLEDSSPVHQRVDSLLWEMHHKRVSYLGDNIEKLQRPLLIQDILGDMYARYELDSDQRKWKNSGWQSRFALAELHEKLGNYGKAFRLYRRIFDRQFSNKEWSEWLFMFKRLYPLYYNETVNYFAENQNLTPAIVWAIIKKESAFKAEVVSVADAYGLMQIIPPTARQISRELGVEMNDVNMLFKPEFNINLGIYYISELLKRYHWNLYYALAAYNAGPHRVDRWQKNIVTMDDDFFMENIEFSETRGYVRTVMKYYWTYYLLLHPQRIPEDVFSFPQKLVREPWYKEIRIN
ncbi:MAG: transglycosylase SLT domain-containing protein, partial [Calditrichia bacterium]